jgi:hypothetical protein
MKSTAVLRDTVQLPPQCTERSPIDAMTVRRGHNIWPCMVNRRVDHEGGSIEQAAVATVNDLAFVIDLDQVGRFHQGECNAKRVHPERRGVHGVLRSSVTACIWVPVNSHVG